LNPQQYAALSVRTPQVCADPTLIEENSSVVSRGAGVVWTV
jgi:hypothetical protein